MRGDFSNCRGSRVRPCADKLASRRRTKVWGGSRCLPPLGRPVGFLQGETSVTDLSTLRGCIVWAVTALLELEAWGAAKPSLSLR